MNMLKITITGNIQICVPNTIKTMTPYVLLEQEDWFEDEIKFVRKLVQPGAQVIDIGANFGLYTLTLAKLVAPGGIVWAFEPASQTAAYLARSIDTNSFDNIHLIQAALSAKKGRGRLNIFPDAETNSLVTPTNGNNFEEVDLLTLDDCAQKYEWKNIGFIKLDAEGEEQRIITGGKQFLSDNSPLIMFELRHEETVNLHLIEQLSELGYAPYRLLPGLGMLAPLEPTAQHDPFLLNVFCCKPDHAGELEKRGLLTGELKKTIPQQYENNLDWQNCLNTKKYYSTFKTDWEHAEANHTAQGQDNYTRALLLYCMAHADTTPATYRGPCLDQSRSYLQQALSQEANLPRLLTYARISWESGNRSQSIQTLNLLLQQNSPDKTLTINEAFLPPSPRFDDIPVANKQQVTEWTLSSIIEQFEKIVAYSSFFVDAPAQIKRMLIRLDYLSTHSFQSAEMERRRQLVKLMQGHPDCFDRSGILNHPSENNLNAALWREGLIGCK